MAEQGRDSRLGMPATRLPPDPAAIELAGSEDGALDAATLTRAAMPASATLPHARGSYTFLLPTSPSTLSTPS